VRRNNTHILLAAGLSASLTVPCASAHGQEALRYSLAGEAAAESKRLQMENLPYTIKTGDFRLLLSPSLEGDWNSNVYLSKDNPQDDYILRPALTLDASYPISQRNLLQLNVTAGYNKYFNHNDLSQWFVTSGSALSFDFYTGDFAFNVHDRFSYTQDSATEAAVANTGTYGTWQNIAGLSGTWDLQDVTLTLGYDHLNFSSTTSAYDYTSHASEMLVSRAGLNLNPTITAGLEGTASFTSYYQKVLNNNINYSGGIYGAWKPGTSFTASPRFGYTVYDFQQTSYTVKAENQNAWYADLTVNHAPTATISYSFSFGHELRLGIQSDLIEDTYVRPAATWKILKDVSLQASAFYEHGSDKGAPVPGAVAETYDWYGGELSISYSPVKRVNLSLNYRLTLRSSDVPSREYTQNQVGLLVTYRPQ
jgi:hypothetical protein